MVSCLTRGPEPSRIVQLPDVQLPDVQHPSAAAASCPQPASSRASREGWRSCVCFGEVFQAAPGVGFGENSWL